jgi:iron complex outermembrane receptor protein
LPKFLTHIPYIYYITMQRIIKSIIYILCLLPAIPAASFAQAPRPVAKITGTLVNEQNKPVEFATVSLLRAKDSSLVKGALGSLDGVYFFERVNPGTYIVKATVVGYNKGLSKPFAVTESTPTINLPAISMAASALALKTVSVQSTRPLIERKLDRTVMNVENSVLAAGNSALEILERAPGVSVDKDDNISLNGKAGVTVMINDKLTYLSSTQLATLLRSTDGGTIATIEVITNPSAKYDASGNSGIINIKLKKNRQAGTSGSVTAGTGYGSGWKDNESLNLNVKQGKLNAFGNFSHYDNKSDNRTINIKRVVDSATSRTYFNQFTGMNRTSHGNSYRVGVDYDLSKKNTLGFVINGYDNSEVGSTPTTTYIGKTLGATNSFLNSTSVVPQQYKNFAANVNDRWQLDSLGQELAIDLDYSKFRNNGNAMYTTNTYLPNGQLLQTDRLRNQTPSVIDIRSGKADYTYPITKTIKLETGAKFSDVKTDNNLQAQVQNAAGNFVNDTSRTNHFIYQEKIDAGYLNLSKTYKNTSVQVGLRAEYTSSTGTLVTAAPVERSYLDFFPSLFVNHTLDKKNEIGFSYSRRIDRPNYDNLNPFIFYLDKYTFQKGNPFLKPQYTHSFELDYTWNKTINVSVGYSRTTDVITQIILTDSVSKASFQTNLNLQVQNAYSMNINSPYTITKWWTGNANLNMFYLGNKSAGLLGANLNNGQLAYQLKATQKLLLLLPKPFAHQPGYVRNARKR